MILAAGRGKRLRPLTDTRPKALIEVAGAPLVVHAIERLRAAGITDLIINLGWLGGRIRETLGDGSAFGATIRYSDEGDNTLETGGGIVNALPLLGGAPFWVVNADVLCDYPFADPRLSPRDLAHFVLVANAEDSRPGRPLPQASEHARRGNDGPRRESDGDFTLADGRVRESNGERLTYAGIGLYRPEFFAGEPIERKPLLPMMRRAVAAGRIAGEHYRGRWLDVGTPDRLAAARAHRGSSIS